MSNQISLTSITIRPRIGAASRAPVPTPTPPIASAQSAITAAASAAAPAASRVITRPDGSRYEGQFDADLSGRGTRRVDSHNYYTLYEGEFTGGRLTRGTRTVIHPGSRENVREEGCFRLNHLENGVRVSTASDGRQTTQAGTFDFGLFKRGTLRLPYGTTFQTTPTAETDSRFGENRLTGPGIETTFDGTVYRGFFVGGQKMNEFLVTYPEGKTVRVDFSMDGTVTVLNDGVFIGGLAGMPTPSADERPESPPTTLPDIGG